MEEVTVFKWLSLAGLLVISIAGSILPLVIQHKNPERSEIILSHFSFYTGGIFLGAGLLHMLNDSLNDIQKQHVFGDNKFPFGLFTCALGFICIWALEKIHFNSELGNAPIERERMVAVSAKAWLKSANICYVTVAPTTTYTTLIANGIHNNNTLKVSNVPPRSISSPALNSIDTSSNMPHKHNITLTPKHNSMISASPLIMPIDAMPLSVQESLSGSSNNSSTSKRTNTHTIEPNSALSLADSSSDDNSNAIALSSYQQQNSPLQQQQHVIDIDHDNNQETNNNDRSSHKQLIINTMKNDSAKLNERMTNSPKHSSSLRQQAYNNIQNAKKKHNKHSSIHIDSSDNNNNNNNSMIHEHTCIDNSNTHNKHNSSTSSHRRKQVRLLTDDDDDDSDLSNDEKHHLLHHNGHHSHSYRTMNDDNNSSSDDYEHTHQHDNEQLHDHSHGNVHHHHIVIQGNLFLPIALTAVFSLHSIIEGAALGIQNKLSSEAIR